MPRRKKTGVERTTVTPADSWQLLDHLWYAVYRTCQQLRWDMDVVRRTESFCKIETWLPDETGTAGISFVDVYLDVMTPGKLVNAHSSNDGVDFYSQHSATEEARAFLGRLSSEFQRTLVRWIERHGETERGRIRYLLHGSAAQGQTAKASTKQVRRRSAPAKSKRSARTHAAEAQWPVPSQVRAVNSRQRGMSDERQKRAWTFKRIKDSQPAMSYAQVALAARSQGFAEADQQDVRNDYRAMGWQWERAERSR